MPRSPKGRATARWLDARLRLQHPFVRAGDASPKTQSKNPLDGDHGIYRATTDRNGMARMKVAADHYLLHASGLRRVPYRDHLDATRPVELRILMAVEQQESPWPPPDKPQERSIAQVLR